MKHQMKNLDTTQIEKSLAVILIDLHKQKILSAKVMQAGLDGIRDLSKVEIQKKTLKDKLSPMISMLAAMRTQDGDIIPVKTKKNAKCKTCNDHGQVREVSKSFFGNIVNVIPCPDCP